MGIIEIGLYSLSFFLVAAMVVYAASCVYYHNTGNSSQDFPSFMFGMIWIALPYLLVRDIITTIKFANL